MRRLFSSLALAGLAGSAAPVSAQTSVATSVARFEVPADCPSADAFAARLEALGAVPGETRIEVEVRTNWAGNLRGVVALVTPSGDRVERAIEDEVCADVVDALAIAAALALRGASGDEAPTEESPDGSDAEGPGELDAASSEGGEAEPTEPAEPEAPEPTAVRAVLGGGLRVGLGPVPGLSVAPDVRVALELDRFVVALHALGWPESAAPEGAGANSSAPGVALYAVGGTLEVGARLGDVVAVTPAAALELAAVVGRGVGVERPRIEPTLACDLGVSATLEVSLGPVRVFLRADALLPLTQPAYVVAGEMAYRTPIVRGTGMFGLSYDFGGR